MCCNSSGVVGGSPVFQSTTVTPPSSSANTASMRPRTTRAGDHHVERDLHLQRAARRPGRQRESGLQFLELATVLTVGVDGAGQVVEVEELLRLEVPLHPFVERRAQQRLRVGPPR